MFDERCAMTPIIIIIHAAKVRWRKEGKTREDVPDECSPEDDGPRFDPPGTLTLNIACPGIPAKRPANNAKLKLLL